VRAINAGVRGYGTDQDYLYFRERGLRLEPDLVVFFHSSNDPSDNTTLHEMRRPFGKPAFSLRTDGALELVGSPVPHYPSCSRSLASASEAQRVERVGRVAVRRADVLFDHSALFSYLTLALPWDYTSSKLLLRRESARGASDEHGNGGPSTSRAAHHGDRLASRRRCGAADRLPAAHTGHGPRPSARRGADRRRRISGSSHEPRRTCAGITMGTSTRKVTNGSRNSVAEIESRLRERIARRGAKSPLHTLRWLPPRQLAALARQRARRGFERPERFAARRAPRIPACAGRRSGTRVRSGATMPRDCAPASSRS
jgi:hypothetical protein